VTQPPIFTQLAASRQAFLAAIEDLNEETITSMPVEGVWTIKDLIGHLAAWEWSVLVPLKDFAAGGAFAPEDIPDHNAWNALQAQSRAGWPLAQTLDEYHVVRQELVETAQRLTPAQWETALLAPWGERAPLAKVLSGLVWHESNEHLKSITYWKQNGKHR
jgi:uncharacterized damage-inducible protein DinB